MAGFDMAMREERMFFHSRSAQVVSERHTILEDCHSVLYDIVHPAHEVSYFPKPAMKDEYHGGWPAKTVTVGPLPPLRQVQYYPAQKPHQMKKGGVLTSTEAAKIFGGVCVTEYGTKKYPRRN